MFDTGNPPHIDASSHAPHIVQRRALNAERRDLGDGFPISIPQCVGACSILRWTTRECQLPFNIQTEGTSRYALGAHVQWSAAIGCPANIGCIKLTVYDAVQQHFHSFAFAS